MKRKRGEDGQKRGQGKKNARQSEGRENECVCVSSKDSTGHALPLGWHTVGRGNEGLTCRCSCLITEELGPAAWDDLEVRALWGLWQVLGSSSQECIEVLQPRDLADRKHDQPGATREARQRK